ncbi:hypothetical protein ACFX2J_022694 [Malus domestica]
MARLNMCHNTREWHRDVIRKIKWLNEKEISVMIDIEGQIREMEQGLNRLIVFGSGRWSDLNERLQDILEGVNEANILPEKFDSALTSSGSVTIYNENSSSSGNYASCLFPVAALAAGYCNMWWGGWSFSDVISVEALNKGKKQKTRDGGYSDVMESLHDLSVSKAVDMVTGFKSALAGHVNNIIRSSTLLMIGKSILSSSNKTQEANVNVVLGASDLSLLVENISVEQLGLVRKVTIFTDSTTIISDAASKDGLQVHGGSPFDIMGRNHFLEKQLQGLQIGACYAEASN